MRIIIWVLFAANLFGYQGTNEDAKEPNRPKHRNMASFSTNHYMSKGVSVSSGRIFTSI